MYQFLITLLLELTPVDLIYTRIDFSEKYLNISFNSVKHHGPLWATVG